VSSLAKHLICLLRLHLVFCIQYSSVDCDFNYLSCLPVIVINRTAQFSAALMTAGNYFRIYFPTVRGTGCIHILDPWFSIYGNVRGISESALDFMSAKAFVRADIFLRLPSLAFANNFRRMRFVYLQMHRAVLYHLYRGRHQKDEKFFRNLKISFLLQKNVTRGS
jgi:hypothetical protein